MKRYILVFLFIVSTNVPTYAAWEPFVPHLNVSVDDPIVAVAHHHFGKWFWGEAPNPKSIAESPLVSRLEYKKIEPDGIKGYLYTADAIVEGKERMILSYSYWFNWRDEICNKYLTDADSINSLLDNIRQNKNYKGQTIESDYCSGVRLFQYNNNLYMTNRNNVVHRVTNDRSLIPVCTIDNWKRYDVGMLKDDFPFVSLYVKQCRKLTSYCSNSRSLRPTNAGERYNSRAIYRPWATVESKWKNDDHKGLWRTHFNSWKYTDIWSYREFSVYENAKKDAVRELSQHYMDNFDFSKNKAQATALQIIENMPGEHYTNAYCHPLACSSTLEKLANGTYTDWDHLNENTRGKYQRVPPVAYSLALDAPELLDVLFKSVPSDTIVSDYNKDLLMYAVHMNNYASVKYLVDSGWPINEVTHDPKYYDYCTKLDRSHRSALTYAAENASIEIINYLVQAGADTSIKDSKGNDLDFYIKRNPRFSDIETQLGFQGLLKKYSTTPPITPSFNCNAASTRIEKAICASDSLAIYDRELNTAYKEAASHLDDANSLKHSQIQWINFRNDYCDKFTGESQLKAAIARTTRARTRYLRYINTMLTQTP